MGAHPESGVRDAAVLALWRLAEKDGEAAAIAAASSYLGHERADVRRHAADALVHIASKVAGDSHDLAIMSASAYLMSDNPEISQDAYRTFALLVASAKRHGDNNVLEQLATN